MPEHDLRRLLTREEVRRVFRIDRGTLGGWIRRRWLAEAGWLPSAPPARRGRLQILEVVDRDLLERLEERLAQEPQLAEALYVAGLPLRARAEACRHLRLLRAKVPARAKGSKARGSATRTASRPAGELRHGPRRRSASDAPALEAIAHASASPSLAAALWTDALVDSVRAAGTSLAAEVEEVENETPSEAPSVNVETEPGAGRIAVAEDDLFGAGDAQAPTEATSFVDEEVRHATAHAAELAAEADAQAPTPMFTDAPEPASPPPAAVEDTSGHTSALAAAMHGHAPAHGAAIAAPPDALDLLFADALVARGRPAAGARGPAAERWPLGEPRTDDGSLTAWGGSLEAIEQQLARIGEAIELATRSGTAKLAEDRPALALDPAALRDSLSPLVDKLGAQIAAQARGSDALARGLAKISADLESLPERWPTDPPRSTDVARDREDAPADSARARWRSIRFGPTGQLTLVAALAAAWALALRWRLQSSYPSLIALAVAVLAAVLAILRQRKGDAGPTRGAG